MRLMFRLLLLFSAFTLIHCSSEPEPEITSADGATMLLVQAGEFSMGGMEEDLAERPNSGYLNYESERPVHKVKISSFYLDKFEVTNQQYDLFLAVVKKRFSRSIRSSRSARSAGLSAPLHR